MKCYRRTENGKWVICSIAGVIRKSPQSGNSHWTVSVCVPVAASRSDVFYAAQHFRYCSCALAHLKRCKCGCHNNLLWDCWCNNQMYKFTADVAWLCSRAPFYILCPYISFPAHLLLTLRNGDKVASVIPCFSAKQILSAIPSQIVPSNPLLHHKNGLTR